MSALTDKILESQEEEIFAKIAEMGTVEDIGRDIPIDQARMDKIKARDPEPRFVVVEIESGWSKSKREWPPEIVEGIVRQVNEKKPVGYMGHIPANQDETSFPPVQTVWLGAVVKRAGEKVIARVKGYLMPKGEIRDYADLEAVDGVSVRGDTTMVATKGGWRVKEFALESIDWARKGRSGMPTRIVSIASEMEGGKVEPKDIAALDEQELRTHAPLLVKEVERKVTEPLTTKLGEMEATATATEPELLALKEIREKLGLNDDQNPIEAIADLLKRVETAARAEIKAVVAKAVERVAGKNKTAQDLVHRLIGEQITRDFNGEITDKTEDEITDQIKSAVEGDETVKAIVGEMSVVDDDKGGRHDNRGGAHVGSKSKGNEQQNDRGRSGSLLRTKRQVA